MITQAIMWLLLVVAPALSILQPETFSQAGAQVFGWLFVVVALFGLIYLSTDYFQATKGADPEVSIRSGDRIIAHYNRFLEHRSLSVLTLVRNLFAVCLYFVLGLGWLAFTLAVTILAYQAVRRLSYRLARKLIKNGGMYYRDIGVRCGQPA